AGHFNLQSAELARLVSDHLMDALMNPRFEGGINYATLPSDAIPHFCRIPETRSAAVLHAIRTLGKHLPNVMHFDPDRSCIGSLAAESVISSLNGLSALERLEPSARLLRDLGVWLKEQKSEIEPYTGPSCDRRVSGRMDRIFTALERTIDRIESLGRASSASA